MRHIHVLTGIRSEYYILSPVLRALQQQSGIQPHLLVTGAHLQSPLGQSLKDIRRDARREGWPILRQIKIPVGGNALTDRLHSHTQLVEALRRLLSGSKRPDLCLGLGDREDVLALAICCAYLRIPMIHVHGGERSAGSIDDAARHAISKLAHGHCVSSTEHKKRLLKLGENPWRVRVTGAPGLDNLRQTSQHILPLHQWCQNMKLPSEHFALLVMHPDQEGSKATPRCLKPMIKALKKRGWHPLAIGPNTDPGHRDIRQVLKQAAAKGEITYVDHLSATDYVSAMRYAQAMVGNSSSGLIEAPALGLPVINIGARNQERQCGPGVRFIPMSTQAITQAIAKVRVQKRRPAPGKLLKTPFGQGQAAKRIAQFTAKFDLSERSLNKVITY